MFNIDFYNFIKDENSTKRPTGSPATYPCEIKRSSGLVSPTIELNIGLTTAPAWNYCYIADFNRYYFIDEWTFELGFWTASLSCDALATYRTEIGNADLYALRSSAVYDGRIPDTLYPTKVNCTFNSVPLGTSVWTLDGGVFVVGLVNSGLTDYRFGSVVYYIMNRTEFTAMVDYLLSDNLLNDFNIDITDVTTEVQKSLIDPLQYIKSVTYIPLSSGALDLLSYDRATVNVFSWSIWRHVQELTLVPILKPSEPSHKLTRTFTIPKHPQTNDRGNYVNQSPYSNITLTFPPFGTIEIDTTVTANATEITAEAEIDLPTGLGILTLYCNGIILNRIEAQIGIPVQLTQVTRDYIGGVTSIIGAASNIIGGALAGGWAGAGAGLISSAGAIGDAVKSLTPRAQSIGSGGSYAQVALRPRIEAQFFEILDDDIAKNGRPCSRIVNCKNNPGYYLIQDGDIAMGGTHSEAQIVKGYLESGFYWE